MEEADTDIMPSEAIRQIRAIRQKTQEYFDINDNLVGENRRAMERAGLCSGMLGEVADVLKRTRALDEYHAAPGGSYLGPLAACLRIVNMFGGYGRKYNRRAAMTATETCSLLDDVTYDLDELLAITYDAEKETIE